METKSGSSAGCFRIKCCGQRARDSYDRAAGKMGKDRERDASLTASWLQHYFGLAEGTPCGRPFNCCAAGKSTVTPKETKRLSESDERIAHLARTAMDEYRTTDDIYKDCTYHSTTYGPSHSYVHYRPAGNVDVIALPSIIFPFPICAGSSTHAHQHISHQPVTFSALVGAKPNPFCARKPMPCPG